jgi:L-rhamnose mutarotase
MAADPKTQAWWSIMMPMQQTIETQPRESGGLQWKRCSIPIRAHE